jgi:hypothetical protein
MTLLTVSCHVDSLLLVKYSWVCYSSLEKAVSIVTDLAFKEGDSDNLSMKLTHEPATPAACYLNRSKAVGSSFLLNFSRESGARRQRAGGEDDDG